MQAHSSISDSEEGHERFPPRCEEEIAQPQITSSSSARTVGWFNPRGARAPQLVASDRRHCAVAHTRRLIWLMHWSCRSS
jgi:hypothetical protein